MVVASPQAAEAVAKVSQPQQMSSAQASQIPTTDWMKHNVPYWHNKASGESSWSEIATIGWMQHFLPYWYNKTTGMSSWNEP